MSKNRKKKSRKSERLPTSSTTAPVQNKYSLALKCFVTAIGIIGTVVTVLAFYSAHVKQRALDNQLARAYQTEILHYYSQFAVGLHWTLPIGPDADTEVDGVFKYNRDLGKGMDLGAMHRDLLINIFKNHDFTQPMRNYEGVEGLNPTGFNHVLGNIDRFAYQLYTHLEKYGSDASAHLTSRIEYAERMAKAETGSIRMDLQTKGSLLPHTAEGIADFLLLLRSDLFWIQKEYGAAVDPVFVGKVLKSHATDGSMTVQWEYGKY